MEEPMKLVRLIVVAMSLAMPGLICAAPASDPNFKPHLEHMAVWVKDLDKTAAFLSDALGWRRHPLQFGVNDDSKVYGGMKLGFVDANGIWLELVQPTTPGPGMDFLKEKGNGALVELDFFVDDFDKAVAAVKAKGIQPMGMDGKPMVNGGLLSEWAIKDGKRVRGDERLLYFPMEVSRGTSVEIGWEYPNGVVLLRDATWNDANRTPRSAPHVDHTVVLAADLEKTSKFYTDTLGLPRHSLKTGVRKEWMGVGDDGHAWIAGNPHGMWIEVVQPSASAAGKAILANKQFGDGMIMELDVEVADIAKFYDSMKAKGIVMTVDGDSPLPAGKKAVPVGSTGDSYSYFPVKKSEGMRIMVFQRGPKATSLFAARDTGVKH
jgi:catechol 2,3-dioxygenase-like lactoylglutathione lyase family enzyme